MTFWVAGAVVVGGALAANAAGDAADTQAQSARDATAAQERTFDKQVQLQEPWRQAGGLGLNALLQGLGLSPTGTFLSQQAQAAAGPTDPVTTAYRELLNATPTPEALAYYQAGMSRGIPLEAIRQEISTHPQYGVAPLASATPAAATGAPTAAGAADPNFGALMHDFTMADFQADPGYAFRLQQGEQALQRAKSASGSLGSGAYLKDLTDYSQGMASQEYGNAFNRFQTNRGTKLNALQSLAGVGQSSANTLTGAAGHLGQQIGSNIVGAGNAAAAGKIGQANALTGALGRGVSMYQQNQLLNRISPYGYGGTPYNPATGPTMFGDFPTSYFG